MTKFETKKNLDTKGQVFYSHLKYLENGDVLMTTSRYPNNPYK